MTTYQRLAIFAIVVSVSACATDGGPSVLTDSDHKIRVGSALEDSASISVQVKERIQGNGQTANQRIVVSSPKSDVVQLSGLVDNTAVIQEAERMAYSIDGVRFVINNLKVRY